MTDLPASGPPALPRAQPAPGPSRDTVWLLTGLAGSVLAAVAITVIGMVVYPQFADTFTAFTLRGTDAQVTGLAVVGSEVYLCGTFSIAGDAHYRLGFGGSCDALMRSSIVQVATGGEKNRLCAKGSTVTSRSAYCAVRSVDRIDAEDYERVARRNRR